MLQPLELGAASSDWDEEVERFAQMTPEQRLSLFLQLCDLTDSVQANRPNRIALRAAQPRSEAAERLWAELMRGRVRG